MLAKPGERDSAFFGDGGQVAVGGAVEFDGDGIFFHAVGMDAPQEIVRESEAYPCLFAPFEDLRVMQFQLVPQGGPVVPEHAGDL